MSVANPRRWGWGRQDRPFKLEDYPAFWPALQQWLGLSDEEIAQESPAVPVEEIALRPTRLDDPVLSSLHKLLGQDRVRTDTLCRVAHAYGKSYCDLVRLRAGYIPNPPDAVVYPADQAQIAGLLQWAADRDVAVIPFGGGSSLVGGVEPLPGARLTITLDMTRLNRVLDVDVTSRTARIQAGATGPQIEAQLNARGFTLGHFPQSFEFSTLGGWIATRSVGQNSIGYGTIETLTQAVRLVAPAGLVETRDAPTVATGPSLLGMLIGSAGAYGVITEATMQIHPRPAVQDYRGVLFRDWADGVAAFRTLLQTPGLHPAIIYLSDPMETATYAVMSREQRGLRRLAEQLAGQYRKMQGLDPANGTVLMLLGFDGDAAWTSQQWDTALKVCGDWRGVSVGRAVGRAWLHERYTQPYLRDILLSHGILMGTVESATSWKNLPRLYEAMTGALKATIRATSGGPGCVRTHIAHACAHGASLSATFLGRQVSDPDPSARQAQWQEIEHATTDAILAAGGALSHHYGVGCTHAPSLEAEIGRLGVKALRALKQVFDPTDTMNPGVLLRRTEEANPPPPVNGLTGDRLAAPGLLPRTARSGR